MKVIGVSFRSGGKFYYFDPLDLEVKKGDHVIVETSRGVECGRVVIAPTEIEEKEIVQPLRQVIRKATDEDLEAVKENEKKEKEAYHICKAKIREHELDMKLVAAECTFDGKKMLFYFTADGRVDFRDLVKDLAWVFRTRIELRQIGVRDETKMLGGIGICGRPLCCSTYRSDFAPVSIKMAKEQNLSLNPTKISGVCGRLMCCLKNEEEAYEYLNKSLPGIGDIVETPDGKQGIVQSVNVIRQNVRILIEAGDDKEMENYPASELVLVSKRKKGGGHQAVVREIPASGEKEIIAMLEGDKQEGSRQERPRRENRNSGRRSQEGRAQENRFDKESGDRENRGESRSSREGTGNGERSNSERGRSRDRNREGRRENNRDHSGKERENGREKDAGRERESGREREAGRRNRSGKSEGDASAKIKNNFHEQNAGRTEQVNSDNNAEGRNNESPEKRHRRRHRRKHSGAPAEQGGNKEE